MEIVLLACTLQGCLADIGDCNCTSITNDTENTPQKNERSEKVKQCLIWAQKDGY